MRGDIPVFNGAADTSIVTSATYASSNPAAVQGFVNAIAVAQKYLKSDPADAAAVIKKVAFPSLDQQAFTLAFSDYESALNTSPVMTEDAFDKAVSLYQLENGNKPISLDYGKVYDPQFATKATG